MASTVNSRNLYDDKVGSRTDVVSIVCTVISVVALFLRLLSRYCSGLSLGADDVFSVLAVVFFVATAVVALWGYKLGGWGIDPLKLPPELLEVNIKSVYMCPLFSVTSIVMAKLSILFLYRRIFGVDRTFRLCVNLLIAFSIIWGTVLVFMLLFQCSPVAAGWDVKLRPSAKCINLSFTTVISEPLNGFSEVLMFILPINSIRKLHLPLRQRVGLSVIFGLGILCVASSIARAIASYWNGAQTSDITVQSFWVALQTLTAILVGCLPTYRRLLPQDLGAISKYFRRRLTYLTSLGRDPTGRRAATAAASDDAHRMRHVSGRRPDLNGTSTLDLKHSAYTEIREHGTGRNGSNTDQEWGNEVPAGTIHVKHEIDVA